MSRSNERLICIEDLNQLILSMHLQSIFEVLSIAYSSTCLIHS